MSKVLDSSHALNGNIVRALQGNQSLQRMDDIFPGNPNPTAAQTTNIVHAPAAVSGITPIQSCPTDGSHWFEVDTSQIRRSVFATGSTTHTNSSPFASLPAGINHLGGSFVDDTYLYVIAANWGGGSQTSTKQTIAIYDKSDLTYHSQIDISGSSDCNGSGICLGHTGNFFVTSYYSGASPDDRLVDVYEFDASGAEIAVHTMDEDVVGAQDITYDSEKSQYAITSHDTSVAEDLVILNTAFEVIERWDPAGIAGTAEIEGVHWHNGIYYPHQLSMAPRAVVLGDTQLMIGRFESSAPFKFIESADVPDEGTIVFRGKILDVYNYNTLFDNEDNANHWEMWIYSDGRLAGRVNSATSAISLSGECTADTDAIIAFAWTKSGSTVDTELFKDGASLQTSTGGTWVAAPSTGLWAGGKHASNTLADFIYRDIFVFDKHLSGAEFSSLNADFDALYADTGGVTQLPGVNQSASGSQLQNLTGTAAQTLGALSQSASAAQSIPGTAMQALSGATQAGSATHTEGHTGTVTQTLGAVSQSSSALMLSTALAVQTLAAMMQAASGTHNQNAAGSSAQSVPAATQAGAGSSLTSGAATQTLAPPRQIANGVQLHVTTATQVIARLLQSGAGTASAPGASTQSLPKLVQTADGTLQPVGVAAPLLPALFQTTPGYLGESMGTIFAPGVKLISSDRGARAQRSYGVTVVS